jgi:hypothetical protein
MPSLDPIQGSPESGNKEVAGDEVTGFDFEKGRLVLFSTIPVL